MRTLTLLAALFLFSPLAAQAAPTRRTDGAAPLVHVASDDDADEADDDEGCLFTYLCYKLPSDTAAVPWVKDNGLKYVLVYDIGLFVAGLFLPFPALWMPLVLYYFLVDEDVRPPLSGDLLTGLLIMGGLSIVSVTALSFIPFGFILGYVIALWIVPVTGLHIYNRAMKENGSEAGEEEDRPRKKKKKASRPKRRRRAEEDEEDDEE